MCRLLIHGPDDLLVDLALDSAPGRPAMASIAGPTFAPAELAGRKLIALFDRAAARDFVGRLRPQSSVQQGGTARAGTRDRRGLRVAVFVEMIGLLSRYSDVDLDLGDVNAAEVRAFFAQWSAELEPGRE